MISSVLRSKRAVQANIEIMRIFVWLFLNPVNDLNVAHPSTLSGRTEDRAGHGEPAEPLNGFNDFNGLQY